MLEITLSTVTAFLKSLPLECEVTEAFADLGALEHTVGGQVYEVLLLRPQDLKLLRNRRFQLQLGAVAARERPLDPFLEVRHELGLEHDGLVEALDGLLGLVKRGVGASQARC